MQLQITDRGREAGCWTKTRPRITKTELRVDAYFSADVETDGPIPGPFSMLSFAIVYAGKFDGDSFEKPTAYDTVFYRELRPISEEFQPEALRINGLDRNKLIQTGSPAETAMDEAAEWIRTTAGAATPVLVAYPLSFDWTWLYWYFIRFAQSGSPFEYSRCFDIKTALAVKGRIPISEAGRSKLPAGLTSVRRHTHFAVDDAVSQAEIFAKVFEWDGYNASSRKKAY